MAIDRLSDVAGPQNGLVRVVPSSVSVGSGSGSVGISGQVTFSGSTSVTIDNCFSGVYQNYRAIVSLSNLSSTAVLFFRTLKTSDGLEESGNIYSYNNFGLTSWSNGAMTNVAGVSTAGDLAYAGNNSVNAVADIFDPYTTIFTYIFGIGSSAAELRNKNTQIGTTTSYRGIKFYVTSGTITGNIRIYGYNN
jgi:hypothetical protein